MEAGRRDGRRRRGIVLGESGFGPQQHRVYPGTRNQWFCNRSQGIATLDVTSRLHGNRSADGRGAEPHSALECFFGTKGGYGVAASTPTTTTTSPSKQLPISVESDNQMQAAGNLGPSSSILIPVSCEQTGTTITAKGTYQGGFAPNLYNRYGDIVELYVFGASFTGYPQGPQLAASSAKDSPAIGGYGSWRVSTTVNLAGYEPARCVIAAQPTHDLQSAP